MERPDGGSADPELQEKVAPALFRESAVLAELQRFTEALAAIADLALGRRDEAAAAFAEVVRRFGSAPEPELREVVDEARKRSLLLARAS